MKAILKKVIAAQPKWFSPQNRRFFGDVRYSVKYGKATGNRYLVRSTYMWSDMLGQPRKLCYRVNTIGDDYKLGDLVDTIFNTREEVTAWLKEN